MSEALKPKALYLSIIVLFVEYKLVARAGRASGMTNYPPLTFKSGARRQEVLEKEDLTESSLSPATNDYC